VRRENQPGGPCRAFVSFPSGPRPFYLFEPLSHCIIPFLPHRTTASVPRSEAAWTTLYHSLDDRCVGRFDKLGRASLKP
jgi:hypothetical protein